MGYDLLMEAVNHDPKLRELDLLFEELISIKYDKNEIKEGYVLDKKVRNQLMKISDFLQDYFNLQAALFVTTSPTASASVLYNILPLRKNFVTKLLYSMGLGKSYNSYLKGDKPISNALSSKDIEQFKSTIELTIIYGAPFIGMEPKHATKKDRDNMFSGEKRMTGRQMTAVLLHEIGHIIYLGDYLKKNSKVARELLYNGKLVGFWAEVSIALLGYRNTVKRYNKKALKDYMKFEVQADSYAVKFGYGQDLMEALSRFELTEPYKKNDYRVPYDYAINKYNGVGFVKEISDATLRERLTMVVEILKKEYNDPVNSEADRIEIGKQIKALRKLIKETGLDPDKIKSYSKLDRYIKY